MDFRKHSKTPISHIYLSSKNRLYKKKIKKIYRHLKIDGANYERDLVQQHINLWKPLYKNISAYWFKVYSHVNGNQDINYIPEDIYYNIVEPCLNDKHLAKAYSDKNFYDLYYNEQLFPEVVLRNINGCFYDVYYKALDKADDSSLNKMIYGEDKIIIKPSLDSGGGSRVDLFFKAGKKFMNSNGAELSLDYLLRAYSRNFVVQKYINQHPFFKKFNETSVNTIRVFTYRSVINEEIIPLHALLRIGRKGSFIDNQASGGISIGINADGILNDFAVDKFGNKYLEINGIELKHRLKIPQFGNIIDTAIRIAKRNLYTRIMGLDLCMDQDSKVRLIEINNSNNEINFYQMNNGALFGYYTDEVIEYCLRNSRSFVLDFYI